jgi:hypothetical protein
LLFDRFWCNYAQTLPKLIGRDWIVSLLASLLLTCFQLACRVLKIGLGNDVVTFKDRARLVTRNGHADFLADSSPHHVAHGCSPQIVKKQTLIFQFVTGPIFPTTRAVIFRIYWCLARRAQQVPDACRSAGIRPNLAKIGDRPALYAAPFFRTDRVKTVEEGPPSNE